MNMATVFVLSCMCAEPLQSHKPAHVDPLAAPKSNPQCWESSSALLLEMRSPRIADTVPALWDLMVFLRSSDNSKHTALFWDLARVFWDLYLDCVLSRSHGLGRRHITAVHSLISDKPFRFNSSGANSRVRLSVRVRPRGHIKTLKTKPRSNTHYHK
ncbi:protein FAM237A-like [Sebastes fasciatus]|uniref:protein FAM237A-like n=1 Tax=Sebastes fasciatus TaxID=394691 RepID=UPI003D9F3316